MCPKGFDDGHTNMEHIMKKINRVILTIIISFTMSCDRNEPNSQDNELTDITWSLFKYFDERSGMNTIIPKGNEYYSINFNNSGEISAHDACNNCTGSFEILNSNSVEITGMSCTEIACLGPGFFLPSMVNFYSNLTMICWY